MNQIINYILTLFLLVISSHHSLANGFTDITALTGINFQHTDGSNGNYWIVESVASGMGVFDYDNDGDLDIYFLNGAALPGTTIDTPPTNKLYRNDGNMKFTDVTEKAGVGDTGYGLGCAMADANNDGFVDLYLSNMESGVFYQNNGDGTFTNTTQKAGLINTKLGGGVNFGDYNQDGWLDVFVANYVTCPFDFSRECQQSGYRLYCDPAKTKEYKPQASVQFFNHGDGTFRDVSAESGIGELEGRGMGVVSTDFDNDGDLDIYVANDVMENYLFVNNGDGTFMESALFNGVAFDTHGREQGSMGTDFGDYDHDGNFDLLISNFQNQYNTLYHNEGGGLFKDAAVASGFAEGAMPWVSWACFFMDYDNDTHPDIFVANGHLQDNIEKIDPGTTYYQQNHLFKNSGHETFEDVSSALGFDHHNFKSVRGGAYGDLDNDGDLDIVLSNWRHQPTILRNDHESNNHWINIQLQNKGGITNGIGARVIIEAGGISQMNEVRAGGSYQSQYDTRLHFGLGNSSTIDTITVRWQDGHTDTHEHVEANHFILLNKAVSEITVLK
jgi:hypothetical protein